MALPVKASIEEVEINGLKGLIIQFPKKEPKMPSRLMSFVVGVIMAWVIICMMIL